MGQGLLEVRKISVWGAYNIVKSRWTSPLVLTGPRAVSHKKRGTVMAIGKTIKKIAKKLKKRPKTHYPPMPEDPKELAQACSLWQTRS